MSLLDLYMLRRYSVCMVLSVLSLWGISFVVDLIENIDVFIDHEAELGQRCFVAIRRI